VTPALAQHARKTGASLIAAGSTDGGASFSALQTVDPTPVKSGPVCTEGIDCSGDRELLDFQSIAIDPAGRANLTWTRSIDGQSDTQIRFVREG
jgi:hypothetical protein